MEDAFSAGRWAQREAMGYDRSANIGDIVEIFDLDRGYANRLPAIIRGEEKYELVTDLLDNPDLMHGESLDFWSLWNSSKRNKADNLVKQFGNETGSNLRAFDYVIYPGVQEDIVRVGSAHEVVSGNRNVLGSGELILDIDTRRVVYFNATSGHYAPNSRRFFPYLRNLIAEQGIDSLPVKC